MLAVQLPTGAPTDFQQTLMRAREVGPHPQREMWPLAARFANSTNFVAEASTLPFAPQLNELADQLSSLPDPTDIHTIDGAIEQTLGQSASQMMANQEFQNAADALGDSVVAAMLTPQAHIATLDDHVLFLRLFALVSRVSAEDSSLVGPGAIATALEAPVALPTTIFPVDKTMIHPVGVADDWVVRQHIARYELGEIASIENILMGEIRKHTTKHTLATEQTLVLETEKTTETVKELQTTDRFDLKSEVESTLKEDTSVKGGISVKYDSSPWTVTANVDASYQRSKTDSSKLATEQAKDVVQRASTKVTERMLQQQTTKVTESTEEDDDHSFDNAQGTDNVTGIYQWVNKVYRVQTFDLGTRVIFDIMVPEPAALLWDLKSHPQTTDDLKAPPAFTAKPGELTLDSIGQYLSDYSVTGLPEPPADHITVSGAYSDINKSDDANANLVKSDVLQIPPGYAAKQATVLAEYNYKDSPPPNSGLHVMVGGSSVPIVDQGANPTTVLLGDEELTLPVAIETFKVKDYSLSIDVGCARTAERLSAWQLQAHDAITQAYLQRVKDYQEKLGARALQPAAADGVKGTNPDLNRETERIELKREAIGLLAGPTINLLNFNGLNEETTSPLYPRPNPDRAEAEGRIARFFEQALEWENMNYFFYPYYWGRKDTWYQRAQVTDDDPLFADFLRAGQARLVVPVRHGFEFDMRYFVRSGGQIWGGAPHPHIHDPDYLPIAKEIEEAQNPEVGTAGESWEVTVPTNQVYLRDDRALPSWQVDNQWNWTPTQTPSQLVTATTPADGSTGVATGVAPTATFSKEIDPSTLTAYSFTLTPAGSTPVAATISYNSATKTVTLTPSHPLAAGTTYTATLTPAVKSTDGTALASPFSWSFRTADAPEPGR